MAIVAITEAHIKAYEGVCIFDQNKKHSSSLDNRQVKVVVHSYVEENQEDCFDNDERKPLLMNQKYFPFLLHILLVILLFLVLLVLLLL